MLKAFLVSLFGTFFIFSMTENLAAVNLDDLLGPDEVRALLSGEKILNTQFRDINPSFAPNHAFLRGLLTNMQGNLDPTVMVETLHLYRKPEAKSGILTREEHLSLYNRLLGLSSLAGIEYFSASRGAMRTFYETSVVIDTPSSRRPLPDPSFLEPPQTLTLYARQRDSTFGDNVYQYDFYYQPGAMIFVQQNLSSLSYGIIPAVPRERLHSLVAVLDTENFFLVYAVSMARTVVVPGLRDRIGSSFANRAEAVFGWFSTQADSVFGLD